MTGTAGCAKNWNAYTLQLYQNAFQVHFGPLGP